MLSSCSGAPISRSLVRAQVGEPEFFVADQGPSERSSGPSSWAGRPRGFGIAGGASLVPSNVAESAWTWPDVPPTKIDRRSTDDNFCTVQNRLRDRQVE